MLGSYTAVLAAERGWETWATCHSHPVELPDVRMMTLDLADTRRVTKAVKQIQPQVIIHTAAQSKPDICEQNRREAHLANTLSASNIVRAAEAVGARIVYVSTDLVFQGGARAYKPDDQTLPPNYYGMTKLAGEEAVKIVEESAGTEPQAFWIWLAKSQTEGQMKPYRNKLNAAKGE